MIIATILFTITPLLIACYWAHRDSKKLEALEVNLLLEMENLQ